MHSGRCADSVLRFRSQTRLNTPRGRGTRAVVATGWHTRSSGLGTSVSSPCGAVTDRPVCSSRAERCVSRTTSSTRTDIAGTSTASLSNCCNASGEDVTRSHT